MTDKNRICAIGKQVLTIESAAVGKLTERINDNFVQACKLLLNAKGHIVIIGMGKSGHIANKIAATMSSTGTPAFFVHPGEASHGDLGMITKKDIVLAISNSGSTPEILAILPLIKQLKIPLITLTGVVNSPLAQTAEVNLDISVEKEACPLGLAPTSSTTATLAMGDALAIALLEMRGFTKHDFALSHPGGRLGKRLLLRVDDLIHRGKAIPKVTIHADLKTTLLEMTSKGLGMTAVVDSDNHMAGIFTDGDLRRALDNGLNLHETKIADLMSNNYKSIAVDALAFDALQLMEQYNITTLIVVDRPEHLAGIIHIHDIIKAGIM